MAAQYTCQNERRLEAVRDHATLNGIDYLEVLDQDAPAGSPRQRTLLLHCVKSVPALTKDQVRIDGGKRVTSIDAEWAIRAADASDEHVALGLITPAEKTFLLALPGADRILAVRTDSNGDFSTYCFHLVQSPAKSDPPLNFDPILSSVQFSFKVECPSDFDCESDTGTEATAESEPKIDYLAKDYTSFRQIMLDRLSTIIPKWDERNPADLGIAVVELLAYAADHLSYQQDAVATEAYLNTARRRVSVRRHARLLDYPMHDGCNARAWVLFTVDAGINGVTLKKADDVGGTPTRLLTRCPAGTVIDEADLSDTLDRFDPTVFELMHDVTLYESHNRISFYTWGNEQCLLVEGATGATLKDDDTNPLHLVTGDVLIFEEVIGSETGLEADRDPERRHAVRLTNVEASEDPLYGTPVVDIQWAIEDALPFDLCISALIDGSVVSDISVARGNAALADHGRTIDAEELDEIPEDGTYRPQLEETEVTQAEPYDDDDARSVSAAAAMEQDPQDAVPAVSVEGGGETWTVSRDLLGSDRFAAAFAVEMEDDGRAFLRFGDDVLGKGPDAGTTLTATYRVGSGEDGNVGADSIAHVVTTTSGIVEVRNPLSAQGGTDPEPLDAVRLCAPQAFRTQERAVTEDDYAEVSERHPEVQKAVATRRWTGSWYTMFITIDRKGGRDVDSDFETELREFLERYRMVGHDLEIDGPQWVPLDIVFTVCVEPGYFQGDVKEALLEVFSSQELSDGTLGFFHPDNFTFGQPVYLSRIVAAAMQVPGVLWVDTDDTLPKPNRFRRWGEPSHGELDEGVIEIGRLEIARLDNDPSAAENGRIQFYMEGGE